MNTSQTCTDIAEFIRFIHRTGAVYEVRAMQCPDKLGGTFKATVAGYFNDAAIASQEIAKIERVRPPGIYITLNPVNPALLARGNNRVVFRADKTTKDDDVLCRQWLFIDIDSKRPSGISATGDELAEADKLSDTLLNAMRSAGWPEPLQGMSGNGRYLLWRIELPNDEPSKLLIEAVLKGLSQRFDTAGAEVDTTTFNAARIIKVLGTTARKGDEVVGIEGLPDRPHRQTWFTEPTAELQVVPVELLRNVAVAIEPKAERTQNTSSAPRSSNNRKAVNYIAKMEPSISGEGGAKKLFAAACKAVHKFKLSDDESLAVLQECFNPRCEPEWDVAGLERAIRKAREEGTPELEPLKDQSPEDVADVFLSSQRLAGILTLRYWGGSYWKWIDGRYVELTKDDVKSDAVRYLQRGYTDIKSQDVGNVLMHVAANCAVMSCLSMPRWLDGGDEIARTWRVEDTFPTCSEIIHLPSLIEGVKPYSIPSSPSYFNGVAADYSFAIDAPPPKRWMQFLNDLFGDDAQSIELLRQWCGYCLTADTRQQKIMLMVGPKRSGKGTIASVMRSLVGDGNCCAPTLSGLATNFGLQALLGKSLAIIGDARLSGRTDVAATTERLLSISGEDAQTVDRKHREPITTQLRARFTIISNELPRLSDASGALAGRLVILRFTKSFYGREDKTLRDALHDERQSILLWAIGGWHSLRRSGRFIEPESSRELVEQMSDIASPITAFVSDCCEIDHNGEVAVDHLYSRFRYWSDANGIGSPMTKPVFSRDLTAAFPELHRKRFSESDRRIAVKGLTLKASEDAF